MSFSLLIMHFYFAIAKITVFIIMKMVKVAYCAILLKSRTQVQDGPTQLADDDESRERLASGPHVALRNAGNLAFKLLVCQ